MDDLVGTAVRETAERYRDDEWTVVLAAGSIPHRLRLRLDGWPPVTLRPRARPSTPMIGRTLPTRPT